MKKINLYIFSRRPEISVGKVRLKKKSWKNNRSEYLFIQSSKNN